MTDIKQLILASNNAGKLNEFSSLLSSFDIHLATQDQFAIESVPETASTFVENALIKARHAALKSKLPALADDSGLCVDYLKGGPGIYSARYAGEPSNDQRNIDKLLDVMRDVPREQRQAHFYCVIVLMQHADDPAPLIAQGIWHGEIATKQSGSNGFGYDPIFYLPQFHCTAAQLDAQQKIQLSHRAQAFAGLTTALLHTHLSQ